MLGKNPYAPLRRRHIWGKTYVCITDNKERNFSAYSEFFKESHEFNDFMKSNSNAWLDYIKGCLFVFFNENKKNKKYLSKYIH